LSNSRFVRFALKERAAFTHCIGDWVGVGA
jgi:hypothetical protein